MDSVISKRKKLLKTDENISSKKLIKNIKNNIYAKSSYLFNIIIIQFFLILLPKKILSENYPYYITLKVNKEGYNQIISSSYTGTLPSIFFINEVQNIFSDRTIYIFDKNAEIKLVWNSYINSLKYMFSNLDNIISIHMNNIYYGNCSMSYLCHNCFNLKKFTYATTYTNSYQVTDVRNMFYNCYSLTSFDFSYIYLDYYSITCHRTNTSSYYIYNYFAINMSYAFYNCQKLSSINFGSRNYAYVYDMRYMFYNCSLLPSINTKNFKFYSVVNSSYMFYNCQSLKNIALPYNFRINDMRWMFFNCKELISLNSFYINSTYSYINISYAFKNCEKLASIPADFQKNYISDTKEAFYNCILLNSISFTIYSSMTSLNMSKMFYNCKSIQSITLTNRNSYFYPNDVNSMFYNCNSLKSLYLNKFDINKVVNMSYMFYNCIKLSTLSHNFGTSITKDMKGMFQNCESLTSISLSNFRSTAVQVTWNMFKGCKSLQTLNLGSFYTSNVVDMESMFEGCSSLVSLNLRNFYTSKVQYMNKMFKDCEKLESLYFPNINTNSLGTMYQMFYNCKNLKYLDIFSLTYNDQSILEMFEGTSNDFIFCVKENENIPYIFDILLSKTQTKRDCSQQCYGTNLARISIDDKKLCCRAYIYNNTCYDYCPGRTKSSIGSKECTFFECEYYYNYTQNGCLPNETIPDGYFINDTTLKTIDKCHKNCSTCIAKENGTTTNCLSCKNDKLYLYMGNCIESCGDLGNYTYPDTGKKICKCSNEKCLECSNEGLNLDLCISCHNSKGYYKKSDEPLYKDIYMDCYKNPLKYYLSNQMYYPCYFSCETCSSAYTNPSKNNHFCYKCDANYSFPIPMSNYSSYNNCYINCTYYYYFDEQDNYTCVNEKQCPPDYQYLIEEKRQCVKSCSNTAYPYEFRKKCYKNCPKDESIIDTYHKYKCKANCPFEKPFEIVETQMCVSSCTIMQRFYKLCVTNYNGNRTKEVQDMIITNIQDDIIDTFNFSYINKERSIILEENGVNYEITTTQTKRFNSKTSRINLNECEKNLKIYYEINETEPLYIFKIDAFVEELSNPKVEYQVYYPLAGFYLLPLDLTMCEGLQLILGYSFNGTGDPMFYDKKSPYYNDICFPYTKNKSDISLKDRQAEYIKNNMSLCDDECKFKGFSEDGEVECLCEIKFNLPLVSQITIDKNKLYKFMDIKNIVNFNVMKCFYLLFSQKGIIINIGFYANLPIIAMYFACIVIFYKKEFKMLKTQINEIVYAKKNYKYIIEKVPKKIKLKKKKKKDKISVFEAFIRKKKIDLKGINVTKGKNENNNKNNINNYETSSEKKRKRRFLLNTKELSQENTKEKMNQIKSINLINKDDKSIILNHDNKTPSNKTNILKDKNKELNHPPIKKSNSEMENIDKENLKETILNDNDSNKKGKFSPEQKQRIIDILKYNDKELNQLNYKEAIKYDRRLYFGFYVSLLKCKHILIKIFVKDDYNSRIIKIFLIFHNFSSNYAINCLFFSEKLLNKIFKDGGKWDIIYQIPQIIYSAFISYIFNWIVTFFALSQENILSLKHEPKLKILKIKAKKTINILEIKFRIFFIISFILVFLYWYYVGCFCAVYKNTQFQLIKDTLISFFTSALISLGINLIPGLFRIPTLKKYSKGKAIIYNFSKLLS